MKKIVLPPGLFVFLKETGEFGEESGLECGEGGRGGQGWLGYITSQLTR